MPHKKSEYTHLLVLRLSSMGDVAMTVPILILLLKQFPLLKLTVVSRPEFEDFFKGINGCNFFPVDLNGRHKGIPGLWKLSTELLKLEADAIADLHDVLRTKVLGFFLRIRHSLKIIQIDKGRKEKNEHCLKKKNKKLNPLKSTHQRYADVFEKLGFTINLAAENSFLEIEHDSKVKKLLHQFSGKILTGLAPFARYEGKTYPMELTGELIKLVLEKSPDVCFFLFGAKSDLEKLEKFRKIDQNRIEIISEEFNLKDQMSIISELKLMVSMDSANMHIASMLGTRVVSIWGYTHPSLGFYGWQQKPEDAFLPDYKLYPTLPSSVNGSSGYKEIKNCMYSIEPKKIAAHILKSYQNNLI